MPPKVKSALPPRKNKGPDKGGAARTNRSNRTTSAPKIAKKPGRKSVSPKQRAEELAALQATVLDISSPRPLSELLALITERSCNLLHASSGAIYLCDPENQLVRCVVSHRTERDLTGITLKYGEGAAGTVAKTGKPLIVDNYQTWPGRAKVYDQIESFFALMAVPVLWQGRVSAVIDVLHAEKSVLFNQDDLELLSLFAAHAAIAVENARLYGMLEQDLREREHAEEALRQNERLLRESQFLVGLGSYVLDIPSGLWKSSAVLDKLFGIDDQFEHTIEGWTELIHPADRQMVVDYFRNKVVRNRAHFNKEYRIIRKNDQAVRWVHGMGELEINDRNQPVKMLGTIQDITDRKLSEKSLQDSEERYRSLFNTMEEGVAINQAVFDENGDMVDYVILDVNPAFERQSPYKIEDALGKKATDLYQMSSGFIRDWWKEHIQKKQAAQTEYYHEPSGQWFFITTTLPIRGRFATIFLNITERKKAENALQEAEIKYRLLVEHLPVAVYTSELGAKGNWHYIGPQIEQLLGFTVDEWMADPGLWYQQVHPEDRDRQQKLEEQACELHESFESEYRMFTRDGRLIWIRDSAQFVTPQNGGKPVIQGVWMDITERRLAEDALAISEAELRALFISMQDAVLVIDRDGIYRKIAPTNPKLLYKSSEELLGKNLRDIFPAEEADKFNHAIRQVLTTRQTARIEYALPIGNHHNWFSASISPMDAENTLWVIRDITERKQAEQLQSALYEIANVAQTTLSLKDLFASIHKTLASLMPAENFYIAIYDAQNDLLSFPYFIDQYDQAPLPQKPGNGLTEYVLRTRQPLLATPQVFEEMVADNQVALLGIASVDWIGVPLTVGDETFGVMVVQTYTDQSRLTQKNLELMTFVSTQAAMVINRKQAEDSLRQRTSQLEALREIGLELIAELDVDKLLHSITAHALTLLHSTGGGIYLYRPEQNRLEWVVAIGTQITPLGTLLERGEGLSGKVWAQRKPIIVGDYEHWEGRAPRYEGKPFKAVMGVPIIKGNEFLGVLVLLADLDQSFNMQEASLLELFAGYAAVAIHNARLYQNARQRLIELEVLYETSNTLSAEHDLDTMLRSIVENARKLLNAATSGMYLAIPGTDELELSMDTSPYVPLGSRLHFGEGAAGHVAQTRRPLRIADYFTWEGRSKLYEGMPIRAVLEVPMLYRGELIGVLTADEAGDSERKFTEADEHLLTLFASQAAGAIHAARLYENLKRSNADITSAYDTTIEGWSRAMDLRDHETEGHTLRVTSLTLKLARRIGLSESQLTHIRRGSLLHDIGKMGVPDAILLKDGNLNGEEWEIMRKHPQLAYEMLSSIDYLHEALDIPSNHHEKWDGTGYPRGLKGEQIPLAARIFAVVDVWDAIRSDRPYRQGWDSETAIGYIKSNSGTHFDPKIVEAFLAMLREE
ncbi:MAG: GAF domain-containing protein [Chloroflexi bacterium]|nr:GAF domain-containing protein [Chloroflexota bacterium]